MESNTEKVRFKFNFDGCIDDVDVEPGIDTVEIEKDVKIGCNTQKSFPDVTKLVIAEEVRNMDIPNSLFPNVKIVISRSKCFKSDVPYLIQKRGTTYSYMVLRNTFFHDKNDTIVLKNENGGSWHINEISDYAFTGCESLKIVTNGHHIISCSDKAFVGSAFERQPFVNGIKMAGPFLIAVDENADTIELPDGEPGNLGLIITDISKVRHMISHDPKTLMSYYLKTLPEWLTLDTSKIVSHDDIEQIMHCKKNECYLKKFDITANTAKKSGLMQDGDVIYTENQKVLISCMIDTEYVNIPDGVETIGENAFRTSRIKSVDIPDSVETIKYSAFQYCKYLESVNFGKGLCHIGEDAFQFCSNLKSVDIPGNVNSIGRNAFYESGLKKINLSEGITEIKSGLIKDTHIKEIEIPSSLEDIDYWALENGALQKVSIHRYNPKIISAIATNGYLRNDDIRSRCVEIICGKKRMYIPKSIKPNMSKTIRSLALTLFDEANPLNHISSFQCAYSKESREHIAVLEYMNYQDEEAKEYLKKRASKMLPRLIEEENEDFVVQFLKLGLISKVTLKKALKQAEDLEKVTIKSYIMQKLGDFGVTKQNFYI